MFINISKCKNVKLFLENDMLIKIVKFIECFYNFSYIKLIKIVYRLTKHAIINLLLFKCKMLRLAFYKFVKMSILTTLMTRLKTVFQALSSYLS